nr:hypothetical protein Q903MT_gene3408 [Picea sitchensis]
MGSLAKWHIFPFISSYFLVIPSIISNILLLYITVRYSFRKDAMVWMDLTLLTGTTKELSISLQ